MIDHLQQDKWFIDVRGEIRGPTSSWDIIQQLIAGHLKVIHRVSRDRVNWKGICNEEYFENAVHTAIDYYSKKAGSVEKNDEPELLDEESGFHNLSQISKGISAQLDHAQNLQEINVGLNSLRKLLSDILHHRKTVIEAKPEVQDEVHPEDRHVYVGMDTGDKTSIFSKNKFLTAVAVIGLIVLGGLKFLSYQDRIQAEALNQQLKELKKAKVLQGYDQVLSETDKLSSSELIALAEDEIEKKNESFGKKLLERAIEIAEFGPDKAKAHSLLGLIAAQDKELDNAAKSYEASMKSSQKLFINYHNYGILKLKTGDALSAETLFLKAIQLKDGPKDKSPTYFGLLEAAIQLDEKDNAEAKQKLLSEKPKDKKTFIPLFSRMDKAAVFLARATQSFVREQTLAEIYIEHVRGRKRLSRSKLLKFLKMKEEEIKEKPSFRGQDLSRIQWTHLYNWCLSLYNRDRKSVRLNALFGYCVYRARGSEYAKPYIDFAAQKGSRDPLYKSLQKMIQKAGKGSASDSSKAAKAI